MIIMHIRAQYPEGDAEQAIKDAGVTCEQEYVDYILMPLATQDGELFETLDYCIRETVEVAFEVNGVMGDWETVTFPSY